jgi:predicted RNA methylase
MLNAKEISVVEDHAATHPNSADFASAPFADGTIFISKTVDEALFEEGMVNEVKRRIQILRKEMKLVESDVISVSISTETELEGILKRNELRLSDEVNAGLVAYVAAENMKEFDIDGKFVRIAVVKT